MRKTLLLLSFIVTALFAVGCNDNPETDNVPKAPTVTLTEVSKSDVSFSFELSTNVAGEYGYCCVENGATVPSASEILASNSGSVTNKVTLTVNNLNPKTGYTLYATVASDGKVGNIASLKFTTAEAGVTPEITVTEVDITPNSFTFEITTNTPGEYGYVYVKEGYDAPAFHEWFTHNSGEITDKATVTIENLNDDTAYNLFVVLRSASNGEYSSPKRLSFTTPDDGMVHPITIDNVTHDTIVFTIDIAGSYVFQCIDKAFLEYNNLTPESYISEPGIGIPSKGEQTVEWTDGGAYGAYPMRVRPDSDYYVIAAIAEGNNVTGEIFVKELHTSKIPQTTAGITTEFTEISSTAVKIKTTPDSNISQYYVYVRDKAWAEGIIGGYGESMLAQLVKNPSAGAWVLTGANEQEWGGLTPATVYYCHILAVDNRGAEALSLIEFTTKVATSSAPEVDASITEPTENPHKTLSLNIFSADANSVKVAFRPTGDVESLRAQGLSNETIALQYGVSLNAEQVAAVSSTGLSIKMEDLYPEVEYTAVVSVKNAEQIETIKVVTKTTPAKAIPARVESNLFTTLQGEWEVSYSLIQSNFNEVNIYNAKVRIAQGVDSASEKSYREQNRLVILDWPFNVTAFGELEHIDIVTPAELMEADPGYWGTHKQLAYRDYGPKIFLEIGAGDKVVVPSERGEYLYNWSDDGTFYFFGCDVDNEFTAPASFPVTISADGNTITIGVCNSGEEFGYGKYRPAVFRDNSVWAIATSDIVLKRVK